MCQTCKDVKGLEAGDALQLIGQQMAGRSKKEQQHLLDLADTVDAEPEAPAEDPELALAYELSVRGL